MTRCSAARPVTIPPHLVSREALALGVTTDIFVTVLGGAGGIDTMVRLGAALSGRYNIVREIGAGGMATVFLARDVRHERDVALKLLRPELGAVLGTERFLSEIRVTAKLQHPHLLPLFDSGEADGFLYYVMPFAEGETLRARLVRERQLSINEAVRIAIAVASALDYAHRRGVVHRDLKPENILIQAGEPVVSDFGIALAVSRAAGERITQSGISLGTPQYMSPEQATGDRQIDGRSDVYSLGAVLYELLTGDPPHAASTTQAIIARVLTEKPRGVRTIRPKVPIYVEAAIDRALEKVPADRWESAAEFCDALKGSTATAAVESRVATPRSTRLRAFVVAAASCSLIALAAAWAWSKRGTPAQPPVRFVVALPTDQRVRDATGTTIALSRDGSRLVYVGRAGAGRQLYVRRLDQLEARALPGTENAASPFFSPDGEWVAYFGEDAKLKKVALAGGAPVVVADAPGIRGGSWGDDDLIIFGAGSGLLRVASSGGRVDTLTRPDSVRGELATHVWPEIMPGGDAVAFMVSTSNLRTARLGILPLRSPERGPTFYDLPCLTPRFVGRDRLLCAVPDGSIQAVPFDSRTLQPTGRGETVLQQAYVKGGGAAIISVARNGTLAYLQGAAPRELVLVDKHGNESPFLKTAESAEYPRFSPDGRRLAVQIGLPGSPDIWIYQLPNGAPSRLTTDGTSLYPEWSPDGERVIFASDRGSGYDIYWQRTDGSAAEALLIAPGDQAEAMMAPNGVVVARTGLGNARRLITFHRGEQKATPLTDQQAPAQSPRLSPDGRWVAYQANATGRFEVYVRAIATGAGQWPISTDGGNFPVWSRDGKVLYYWHGTEFVAAHLQTSPGFRVVRRETLFERNAPQGGHAQYDVTPDGEHFLMPRSRSEDEPLVVVLNWVSEWRNARRQLSSTP